MRPGTAIAVGTRRPAARQWDRAPRKVITYIENVLESGTACLFTMVQGNLVALTAAHWLTASQTGLIAGALASSAIVMARLRRAWVVSVLLGLVTAFVDAFVHHGHFGPAGIMEAVVTGCGASLLSFALGLSWRFVLRANMPH